MADATRILRHGLRARLLHAANALVLLVLLASGLAIGDVLPEGWVERAGGHERLNDLHQWLGLAFAVALACLLVLLARPAARLVRELARFRAGDLRWARDFAQHLLAPARHAVPAHAGELDPAERAVLAVLLLATLLCAVSGVYLYVMPDWPRWVFIVTIRMHIYAAWTLIAALAIHVVAGLGLLPTHRGILRSMFGDGTLPLATAQRLWPEWTRRTLARATREAPPRD